MAENLKKLREKHDELILGSQVDIDHAKNLCTILGIATLTFTDGNSEVAAYWIGSKIDVLNDQSPLDKCRTQEGTRQVIEIAYRIDYGMLS